MPKNNPPMPDDMAEVANVIIEVIRIHLESGEEIDATWFLIDRKEQKFLPLRFPLKSELHKIIVPMIIREIIADQKPDAVIMIAEAYIRAFDKGVDVSKREYKNLRDDPEAREVITITVECTEGMWSGDPEITTLESGKRLIKENPVKFDKIEAHQGPMIGYLPREGSSMN
jgi:hypothetical protein